MVNRFYGGTASSRNCDHAPRSPSIHNSSPTSGAFAPSSRSGMARHVDGMPDDHVRILAHVAAEGGEATLGSIADALPGQPWPISAVMALVDDGRLAVDLDAPFGADWRIRQTASRL